jgi:hypothetical protein
MGESLEPAEAEEKTSIGPTPAEKPLRPILLLNFFRNL